MTWVHANTINNNNNNNNMSNQGVDGVTINDSSSPLISAQLLTPGLTVEEQQTNHIRGVVLDALATMPDLNENVNAEENSLAECANAGVSANDFNVHLRKGNSSLSFSSI